MKCYCGAYALSDPLGLKLSADGLHGADQCAGTDLPQENKVTSENVYQGLEEVIAHLKGEKRLEGEDIQKIIPPEWKEMMTFERWIAGRACCLQPFIFTTALLVDVTFNGMTYDYSARYCYPDPADAFTALVSWEGVGDPPGPWVKEKVSERLGPGALE